MYEELVKRLNAYSAKHECHGGITAEAADAIEELTALAESYKRSMEAWAETASKAIEQIPRWVSVTELLPDAYEDVLLQFPNNQAAGFCDRDGCWGVYSGDGFYTEVADNEPKPTHWAKKLPEPPKEEATNFCEDCLWYESEQMYCFRQGNHSYDNGNCELWEPNTESSKEKGEE